MHSHYENVLDWQEITRLAIEGGKPQSTVGELFEKDEG